MSLHIGQRLGSYEITSAIGKGGMGEVFRARDQKLQRDVAVKVLPDAFGGDSGRRGRFQREAQLLASLNHPNIAHVYGLEESGDIHCIVMELVPGETLEQRLRRGRIPIGEGLRLAVQILEALEAAHEHGIIHRDLKPGNIMVTPDGKVKVLDFGLAKVSEIAESSADLSQSPTRSILLTSGDVILGTAAYMSPEQAKSGNVDRRSDIFSFGCVLYEMVTGRRVFEGDSAAEIVSRVLQRDPDWAQIPAETPPTIRRLIRICLEKDVKRRRQTATDVRLDIEQALAEPSENQPAPTVRRRARGIRFVAWIGATALAIGIGVFASRYLENPSEELRPQILRPSTLSPLEFALSPDGRYLVFVASGDGPQRLWLRRLDETDARPMMGTEGAGYPFWSGDSKSIGFFDSDRLYRIDVEGGPPRELGIAPTARGGAWNGKGTIIFAPGQGPLMRVAAAGGTPVAATQLKPGQTSHRFPHFLPDGQRFLFYAQGSADTAGIYLASLEGGEPKRLGASATAAAYLHPDRVLFIREGTLVAQGLDASRGALTGDPVVIADPAAFIPGINLGGFSVSADGMIAYLAVPPPMQLSWFDSAGNFLGFASEPNMEGSGSTELSPDERRVVTHRNVKNNTDVYVWDIARARFQRLTIDPHVDQLPIWSADGGSIAFVSTAKGAGNLYLKPSDSDGTTVARPILETPNNKAPLDWSKNGFLMYVEINPKTANDLWALDMTAKGAKPQVVANTPFDERMGQFSPDGRWVAYATNESGRFEIVVQAFPNAEAKVPVSTNGGSAPRWKADGRELYFVAPDGSMMAAAVDGSGSSFDAQPPKKIFPSRLAGSGITMFSPQFDVTRDGRFLISQPAPDSGASPITLILNWNSSKR